MSTLYVQRACARVLHISLAILAEADPGAYLTLIRPEFYAHCALLIDHIDESGSKARTTVVSNSYTMSTTQYLQYTKQ